MIIPGIYLLHKPAGPTSFSLMQEFRSAKEKVDSSRRPPRLCHGGTLDPFASGLLLILVEPATRLFHHLHAIPKIYTCTVRWGIETDNGDPLGKIISTSDASDLTATMLEQALLPFIGWQDQIPHATSAKRIDGERAYLKAHRGETVIMPASKVYLHTARWLSHNLPHESQLQISARGGYYVRALARDLGRSLGCGAHLSALHRDAIGPWNDPGPIATLQQATPITGRAILPWAQARILSDEESGDLRRQREIPTGELLPPEWPLPTSFPQPNAPIRGFNRNRLFFLLESKSESWVSITALPGGI